MRPCSTIGCLVTFPGCTCGPKVYPIATGTCGTMLELCCPVAAVGSVVASPKVPICTTGNPTTLETGRPRCRVGDIAVCAQCGVGVITTGKPTRIESCKLV